MPSPQPPPPPPVLSPQAADYFFRPGVQGKRLRPTLLLLLASAVAAHPPLPEDLVPDLRPPHEVPREQRRRQQRIAEIAELIHVASLMHDDVLDDAATRRGVLSLNAQVWNWCANGGRLACKEGWVVTGAAAKRLIFKNSVLVNSGAL